MSFLHVPIVAHEITVWGGVLTHQNHMSKTVCGLQMCNSIASTKPICQLSSVAVSFPQFGFLAPIFWDVCELI